MKNDKLWMTMAALAVGSWILSPKQARAAAQTTPRSGANANGNYGQRLDVDTLKKRFWAKGEAQELRVVRHRLYSKAHKVELGVYIGSISTDPFLSVRNLGGTLGYHFTEYFGLDLVAWKDFVQNSSAYDQFVTFQKLQTQAHGGTPSVPDTNSPKSFMGGELAFSPLYGKLSLMGNAIIYIDIHLLGGAGITKTDTGNDFTAFVGIGQQVYVSKVVSIRLDYRLMHYNEDIPDPQSGKIAGQNSNWSSAITLGATFLIGG